MTRKLRSRLAAVALVLAPLAPLALGAAQARPAVPAVTPDSVAFPQARAPIPVGAGDPQLGRRDALLTLVVFADYNPIPYRFFALDGAIAALRAHYGDELRVVFKDLPQPMFKDAALRGAAARGAYALGGEAAFTRFVPQVGRFPGVIDEEALAGFAMAAGIADKLRFLAGLHDGKWLTEVQQDAQLADALKLSTVPIFYLNGLRYDGMQQADALYAAFDRELAACRAELTQGIAARDVYALRTRKNLGRALLSGASLLTATPMQKPSAPPPPELRPGKGIGPFYLGQSLAAIHAMSLRRTQPDQSGWIRVATELGSDETTYQLRFVKESLAIIDYKLSPGRVGLRVGAQVLRPDEPSADETLRRLMGCGPVEHLEGGSEARCATTGGGKTSLRFGMESDCSPWVTTGPPRECTGADTPHPFTQVRVSKD